MPLPYFDTQRPHLLAHRGLSMHRNGIDENSIEAFRQAIAAGCTHLESDVHATLDGIAVLFHDDDLRRVAGSSQKISELTYAQLSEITLEFGSVVPTLEEVLLEFQGLRLNLDIKSTGAIAPTAEVINRTGSHDRVLVSSFSSRRRLQALSLMERPVATSASMREVLLLLASHYLFGLGTRSIAKNIDALQIPPSQGPIKLSTKSFIKRLRSNGLEVHFWTINDPKLALELIERGATGVVSDRVDLIQF